MRAGTSTDPRGEETRSRSPSATPSRSASAAQSSTQALGRGGLQLGRAAGLRARVEVVDGAAGGERERVLVARPLVRRRPLCRLQDRAALGAQRLEVRFR